MAKREEDIIMKIAFAVGAYLLIIKPILVKLGIDKSASSSQLEEDINKAQISPESAFSPTFYKTVKNAPLIKKIPAQSLAKILRDAVGGNFFGDDVSKVFGVFRKLAYKTQVSWLSKIYNDMYKADLLNDLRNGSKAFYFTNPRAGLSDEETQTLLNIVKNLK
jgi:hypothetical protein